jgi:hypothetical protein
MSDDNGHDEEEIQWGMDFDSDTGAPIMFAVRKPGQVAAQPDASGAVVFRGAASGNKNYDPVTGHFAGKKLNNLEVVAQTVAGGAPVYRSGTPQGVDPLVWERRLDQVRDAARQDEMMDAVSATQFLTDKVADVTQVNMRAFLDDVMGQRIADAVDALDQANKPRRDQSDVKVKAPAGWVRRVIQDLDNAQALHFVKRLEGKGWSPEDINKIVISKIRDPERKQALQQLYGEGQPAEGTPTPKKEEVTSGGK